MDPDGQSPLDVASRIISNEETGLFITVRKKAGREFEVTILGQLNAEEIRDAMLGAVMALGKIAEKGSAVGIVLEVR